MVSWSSVKVPELAVCFELENGSHRGSVNVAEHRSNTVAGNGHNNYTGDGGPALNASLSVPTAVALDGRGNLFVADWFNNRIRVVLSSPPSFTSNPNAMTFRNSSGGPVSAAQDVQLTGTVPGLFFSVTAATADG